MNGALLVAGTSSDAGKSVVTAGLCRWLARRGVRVAPFKAQNMALNSMVTRDGGEIGRAQAMQAAAARVEPEAAMNPILLKPGSDRHSQVVVRGRPLADVDALAYRELKRDLLDVALDALSDLRARFDVVVCEGAGSPAEVNLRASDIANLGLARAADLPVLVVGDIDRGGVFAHLVGTLGVLDAADQRHLAGYLINKFRGDPALLAPGLNWLETTTGRRCFGVLPWRAGLWLDAEDSLDLGHRPVTATGTPADGEVLRVGVVRLPWMSNVTDVDALGCEPGVLVRLAGSAVELADADLVIVPGSRATVSDMSWLRATGI
ncbi:MAG TPA: cobyric acid synthase, partial [Mycobacteriales bacterium]|nr:cobyric acid synthase [Mycobacteriales bacterium]